MHVASRCRVSVVEAVVKAVLGDVRVALIAGAPGFGKTSVLWTAVRRLVDQTSCRVLWINGGVVGSEGHLARIIADASGTEGRQNEQTGSDSRLEAQIFGLAEMEGPPWLLAVDDVDALFFKREQLARLFGFALSRGNSLRFVGTCHPSVCRRLTQIGAFGEQLRGEIATVRIELFDEKEANELVTRRVAGLPPQVRSLVVREAGGHPAALVFLAHLAKLHLGDSSAWEGRQAELLDRAVEFAGSVYAESWALLGPQQRAILWHLGTAAKPLTAGALAEAIALRASQVSAQIRRLGDEGLVMPAAQRAHFKVAPLLARWIAVRATRGRQLARDLEGIEESDHDSLKMEVGD